MKNRDITADKLMMIEQLNKVASERGQTLAQLALSWVLRQKQVTSVLIGASKISGIETIMSEPAYQTCFILFYFDMSQK